MTIDGWQIMMLRFLMMTTMTTIDDGKFKYLPSVFDLI